MFIIFVYVYLFFENIAYFNIHVHVRYMELILRVYIDVIFIPWTYSPHSSKND